LVVLFLFIFLLKGLNSVRLKGIVFAFFNNGFTEEESEDRSSFFKSFDLIILFFAILVFSIVVFNFITEYLGKEGKEI